MEDCEILELFFKRNESALEETEKKYGKYCRYIAIQILENEEDAKETVNDTYLKLWNSIPPKRPDPMKPYVATVCRRTALDHSKSLNAGKRSGESGVILDELEECIPGGDDGREWGENILLRDVLNRFLRSLPEESRNLFIRRYWFTSSVPEIAKEFGMKESTVSMKLFRTRNKLKEYLSKENFKV